MIDSILWNQVQTAEAGKQHEIVQWKYFQITVFAVTAAVKRNRKLRKSTGKLLPVFNCCFVEKHQRQLRNLS